MIKVIEAISDGNIGGAGILLCSRLKNSDREKIETTVVVPNGSMLIPRLKSLGITVIAADCRPNRSFDIKALPQLVRIIKREGADIVNAHGWLTFRIAAMLCGVKLRLYTRHCTFPLKRYYRFRISKLFFRFFTRLLSHHIIAVADVVKDNLIEMGAKAEDISVIINGCEKLRELNDDEKNNLKKKLNIAENVFVLGINARLEHYKGHECLFRALKILKNKFPIKCLIIGDGSVREELKQKCRELDVDSTVIFVGFVEDVSPYMNIVDLNINCSVGTETSSLALSEGMSIGKPAVASDFGGNPYMVRDGVNGFIFPQNYADALAEKIVLLKSDRPLYLKMSENSKKRFEEELNAKAMTKKTEALYERLRSVKL